MSHSSIISIPTCAPRNLPSSAQSRSTATASAATWPCSSSPRFSPHGWSHFLARRAARHRILAEAKSASPNLTLLAEAYWGTEQRLFDTGFAFAYDKTLYDAVRDANAGYKSAIASARSQPRAERFVRFLENHDEARRAEAFPNDRSPPTARSWARCPACASTTKANSKAAASASHHPAPRRRRARRSLQRRLLPENFRNHQTGSFSPGRMEPTRSSARRRRLVRQPDRLRMAHQK